MEVDSAATIGAVTAADEDSELPELRSLPDFGVLFEGYN
jgi:hypothetical protein